jgi:hypothetical protein
VLLVALIWPVGPAKACELVPPIEHVLDPQEQQEDNSPPGQVDTPWYGVTRGTGSSLSCSSTSCDDVGTLRLEIVAPQDDRTGPEDIGYRIEYLEGDMPTGLLPEHDIRADDGIVFLYWDDEASANQEALYFKLSIRAVDLGGNLSEEATVLEIHNPGSCGCGSRKFGPTELMLTLLALLLWSRRRTTT